LRDAGAVDMRLTPDRAASIVRDSALSNRMDGMPIRWNLPASMPRTVVASIALAGVLLAQGCAPTPAPQASTTRRYAIDFTGGAHSCVVTKDVHTEPGKQADVTMKTSNDGWCAIPVSVSGHPYSAGLVTARPAHGTLYIHAVGDDTRIDYTPDAHYVGPDSFTVRLLPGEPVVSATVTVAG
jgi:hypothetical protein